MDNNPLADQAVNPLRVVNVDMVYQFRHHALRDFPRIGISVDKVKKRISGIYLTALFFQLGSEHLDPPGDLALLLLTEINFEGELKWGED